MSVTDLGRRTTELAVRCRDNPGGREAWSELHEAVRRIVKHLAVSIVNRNACPGYDEGDLMQAGWKGVRRAAQKYDRAKGAFTTYMTPWVRQAMQRQRFAMRSTVYVPAHQHVYVAACWRLGVEPDADGAAAVNALRCTAGTAESHEDDFVRVIPDPSPAPALSAMAGEDAAWLRAALTRLAEFDPRAEEIVRRRYGLDGVPAESARQIGDSMGVTRTRIQQIESRAVERLTTMARIWGMRECA